MEKMTEGKENDGMRRKTSAVCALGLSLGLALGSTGTAFADTMYVNASALNLRSGPSTESTVLELLLRGTTVSRESEADGWSVVTVNGTRGYVSSQYLTAEKPSAGSQVSSSVQAAASQTPAESPYVDKTWEVGLDSSYPYASFSKINSGKAIYYHNNSANRKDKVVCVNAGHGTSGGSAVKTLCHPDGSAKVTGGTTSAGATSAVAVSAGTTFQDGTAESKVTLAMAKVLRDKLLAAGYDVLMIREGDDVQLDNIARTVIANNHADCHIALHWDSTTTDKGCFFMSVPSNASYRAMEPVASHWESHNALGSCLIEGLRGAGNKIFSSGSMEMDLTQTSFSTIPSVDIELGDRASSHSPETLQMLSDGLLAGINRYFGY